MPTTFQPLAHQPNSAMEWVRKLSAFEDTINLKGFGAFVAKGCNGLPLEDRVALGGLLARMRYEAKEYNHNMVYRNPGYFVRSFFNELFESLKFPMDKSNKKGFYELVVKAKTGDVNAALQIKNIFNNTPQRVIDALLPFYHAYITHIENECEHLPERVQFGRIANAKEIFLGVISFAFVESKALELSAQDGFTPFIKLQLSKDFRKLRESGIMDGLIDKLDIEYKTYQPPHLKEELKSYFDELVFSRSKLFTQFHERHFKLISPLHERASNLHQFCIQAANQFHMNSDLHKKIKQIGAAIVNAYAEVNTFILKGNEITPNDIEKADRYIQDLVNQNIENMTLLQIAVSMGDQENVEKLMNAGADAYVKSTDYQRDFFTKLQDAFVGFPREFAKNWRQPLPRTIIELAEISGQNDLAVLMTEKMQQRKENKYVFHNETTTILPKELDCLLFEDADINKNNTNSDIHKITSSSSTDSKSNCKSGH